MPQNIETKTNTASQAIATFLPKKCIGAKKKERVGLFCTGLALQKDNEPF